MKEKNQKRRLEILLVLGLFAILVCPLVSAFGVSSTYTLDIPLEAGPGETKDFQMTLQTTEVEGDVTIRVTLIEGDGVVSLMDSDLDYDINVGEFVPVNIRISIPAGTPENTKYGASLRFEDVTPVEEAGTVPIRTSQVRGFGILVKTPMAETPQISKGTGIGLIVTVIIIIVILILIVFFLMKGKNKKPPQVTK